MLNIAGSWKWKHGGLPVFILKNAPGPYCWGIQSCTSWRYSSISTKDTFKIHIRFCLRRHKRKSDRDLKGLFTLFAVFVFHIGLCRASETHAPNTKHRVWLRYKRAPAGSCVQTHTPQLVGLLREIAKHMVGGVSCWKWVARGGPLRFTALPFCPSPAFCYTEMWGASATCSHFHELPPHQSLSS